MTELNKKIKQHLKENGINAIPKYIRRGSMDRCIRIYQKGKDEIDGSNLIMWNDELIKKLTKLGFTDFDLKPLDKFSGHGGRFLIFTKNKKLLNMLTEKK